MKALTPHVTRRAGTAVLMTLLVAGAACGDSGGGGDTTGGDTTGGTVTRPDLPAAVVTRQDRLSAADFAAEVAQDAAFGAVAAGLTPEDAGIVEDSSGAAVIWGEGGGVIAVRHCDAGGACAHARGTRDADGRLSWTDGAPPAIGRPELLKQLDGFDLSDPTHVVSSALTAAQSIVLSTSDLPDLDFTRRRFLALNTFGPVLGTELGALTDVARRVGGFDDVEERAYATEAAVAAALRDLDGLDALVWFGQAVRQEVQGGGVSHRTVGMTVNRGGYGDRLMSRDQLRDIARLNAGGGLGVVVLAASNSYGDGSALQPDDGSLWDRLVTPGCVLVGVEGHADAEDLLYATAVFLDAWFDGETGLGDALAAANATLGGRATLKTSADAARRWPSPGHDALAAAPFAASRIQATIPFTAAPYCAPVGQDKVPGSETATTAFADVTFDGLSFTGDRSFSSGGLDVVNHIRGAITGFSSGDEVYVEAWGDLDAKTRAFHGYGIARVTSAVLDEETGRYRVNFSGMAHTAEFTNESGEECIFNTPRMTTTTGAPAWIELTP